MHQNCRRQNLRLMLRPSYIILRVHRQEGKQCRSWWRSSRHSHTCCLNSLSENNNNFAQSVQNLSCSHNQIYAAWTATSLIRKYRCALIRLFRLQSVIKQSFCQCGKHKTMRFFTTGTQIPKSNFKTCSWATVFTTGTQITKVKF